VRDAAKRSTRAVLSLAGATNQNESLSHNFSQGKKKTINIPDTYYVAGQRAGNLRGDISDVLHITALRAFDCVSRNLDNIKMKIRPVTE